MAPAGAFYRYFTDRYELTLELLQELMEAAFEVARTPAESTNPRTSMLATTKRYLAFYQERRALFGVLVELSQTHPEIAEIWATARKAIYTGISKSLFRWAESGRVRTDMDLDVANQTLAEVFTAGIMVR